MARQPTPIPPYLSRTIWEARTPGWNHGTKEKPSKETELTQERSTKWHEKVKDSRFGGAEPITVTP